MNSFASLTGAVNRAELLTDGYADHEIRAAVRGGLLSPLAPGVLIRPELLDGTPEQHHRELALAWARRSSKPGRVLADVSAVAALGLPVWGLDTSRVVLADPSLGPGSRSTAVARLVSDTRPSSHTVVKGLLVQSPARAVIDVARTSPRVPAIAVGDAALHQGLCTLGDLANELDVAAGMKGIARARRIVGELNGLAESVLESRSRILIVDAGLPMPELQVEIYDQWGNLIARVDFYWRRHRVVGESNGLSKYAGDSGIGRVLYERDRADALMEHGERLINWRWKDLNRPKKLAARLATMLRDDRPRTSTTPAAEHT